MSNVIFVPEDQVGRREMGRAEFPNGYGVVYLKLVFIKEDTFLNSGPKDIVGRSKGGYLFGPIDEIVEYMSKQFKAGAEKYKTKVKGEKSDK